MTDERYESVPLASLRLDPENPRLPREQDWSSEPEERFRLEFYRRYNLIELAHSIADKGFTPRPARAHGRGGRRYGAGPDGIRLTSPIPLMSRAHVTTCQTQEAGVGQAQVSPFRVTD